jgi:outer membrane protein TolC
MKTAIRRVGACLAAFAVMTASASSQQTSSSPADSEPGTLGYYLAAARVSPAREEAEQRLEAAEARADLAGSLPDPTFTYGHYFEEVETRVGPQVARLGVRQTIPLFGKRGLAKSAAEVRAQAEGARLAATALDVELAVTRAYAEYAYLARAVEIMAERLRLLESLEEAVRTRYSDGDATFGDLMSARIALARMEDALVSQSSRRDAASSMLAAAAGLPDDRPLPWPVSIPDPKAISEDRALELFKQGSPDLSILDAEVEAARQERALAGRAYLPDLTLGVDYLRTDEAAVPVPESGKDPIIGTATVSVPLWLGKNSAGVRAADATLHAAERRRDQRTGELSAELRAAVFEVADARRRVELNRERVIPAAEQSLASTDAAYRAGSTDFRALVDAHDTVLASRLALERARADLLTWSSEVARLVGGLDVGVKKESG